MRALVAGGGGHARSVIDAALAAGIDVTGIVDPDPSATYRGIPVVGADGDLPGLVTEFCAALLGVGYLGGGGGPRPRLLEALRGLGYALPSVVDPTAAVATDAEVGDAAFVGKLAVVNSAARVGEAAIVNTRAVVEHDCAVGRLAHVSVGAVLCGGVAVGEGAFVGANATVIQGVRVGAGATVGAGSVVLSDVPDGTRVVGVFDGR